MSRKQFFFLFGLIALEGFAVPWDQIIEPYEELLEEGSALSRQYLSYVAQQSPTIADARIKEIPIQESNEGLIDLKECGDERLQMMPSPQFPFEHPDFNSGLPSASKIRVGLYQKLRSMLSSLDLLAPAFGYEPGQISIHVFEGLRDLETQNELFQKKYEEIVTAHPSFSVEEAELETAKWVSPVKNNIPVHSTGAAVDIRLWDRSKSEFLDMGMFGVIWGKNGSAPTFSEEISDSQKRNRLYCLLAAERVGLTNYSYEFWHFSSRDRYAVYWEGGEGEAAYGALR